MAGGELVEKFGGDGKVGGVGSGFESLTGVGDGRAMRCVLERGGELIVYEWYLPGLETKQSRLWIGLPFFRPSTHSFTPVFDLSVRGIDEFGNDTDATTMEKRRESWQLLWPECVRFPAVVYMPKALAKWLARDEINIGMLINPLAGDEIRTHGNPEEVSVNEIHSHCVIKLEDIDIGPKGCRFL